MHERTTDPRSAFVDAWGEPLDGDALALVQHVVHTGVAAWTESPFASIAPEAFARHLAARLPRDVPLVDALLATRAADLFLAFACATGARGAVEAFEATFASEPRVVFARAKASGVELEDFRQASHAKLFASTPPKIGEYSGQGDLRHWLRVTLMRTLIDLVRSRPSGREIPVSDERIVELPGPEHDPELAYLKQHYRDEFREAFEAAAAELSPEDRNLLRAHLLHGLTVDDVGRMLGVHRATAARRIAKARDDLLLLTRRRLMFKLHLNREELDSVLRIIESNVQLSLSRVLGS